MHLGGPKTCSIHSMHISSDIYIVNINIEYDKKNSIIANSSRYHTTNSLKTSQPCHDHHLRHCHHHHPHHHHHHHHNHHTHHHHHHHRHHSSIHSFIHSFIHYGDLYSALSRLLLRSA